MSFFFKLHVEWRHVSVTLPEDFPQKNQLYTILVQYYIGLGNTTLFWGVSWPNLYNGGAQLTYLSMKWWDVQLLNPGKEEAPTSVFPEFGLSQNLSIYFLTTCK